MNTTDRPTSGCVSKSNNLARKNPARSVLVAVGVGLTVGLLLRTLRPRRAESRATRLLADIRDRFHGIAAPVQQQAQHLAEGSAEVLKKGGAQLHDLHVGRKLQKLARRFTKLFQ